MDKQYDGLVIPKTENIIQKETSWIINKFICGEYLEYPEIVKKFGYSKTFNITTTEETVYLNGLVIVKFGGVTDFQFDIPNKWIKELFELTTNGEITQFRINNTDIIGHIRKDEGSD